VTFSAGWTAEANDALAALAEQPRTLDEVRDACDEYNVSASLYDAAGFGRGFVHRGAYRLI
jgi:hypothetical protein